MQKYEFFLDAKNFILPFKTLFSSVLHFFSLYFKAKDLFHSSKTRTVSTQTCNTNDFRWSYNSHFFSLGPT